MSSSSDSECDGEETKRIKAAAVDFSDIVKNSAGKSNVISFCEQPFLGGLNSDYTNVNKASISTRDGHLKQNLTSKRPDKVREQEPEHELQTTPEFRSFVAKKLAAIIDRSWKCH
ncbi:hypothetical protein LSH36_236g03039 [Paralvinella palmiformis]|uniref:Protein CUSTOS n=1 Tax=Paralvinella palmiformis TaxID=53620 RepID=A0AAD9N3Q2_9ANNE|nr:hypothetical protein LSH36_236g03039 [Paralvinella palmiformis]